MSTPKNIQGDNHVRGHRRPAYSRKQPTLRLDLAIDEYERDLARRAISTETIRNYRKVLDLVRRFWQEELGRAPTLDDVTVRAGETFLDHLRERGQLSRWHGELRDKPLSVETLRTYVRALKAFTSWLAAPKQRYTQDNRFALLPMPRKPQTYKLPLTAEEIQALVDACDMTSALGPRDLAMLVLLLDGGLRAGDLITLRVADVNTRSGRLFITSGKGRKSRHVTVGEDTARILARYAFFSRCHCARGAVWTRRAVFSNDPWQCL
jgi:integrase/recombinase XerD